MISPLLIPWAAAGALLWTFLEYAMHRGLGHRPGRLAFTREHMRHHREPDYFAPTWRKVAAAARTAPVLLVLVWAGAGVGPAVAFTVGFTFMYAAYEVVHRRVHTHAPRGPYGRWARRHHFYHHFMNPRVNHGVTSPIWDLVFGTYARPPVVRVPARHAMRWLVTGDGSAVRAPFAADYALFRRGVRDAGAPAALERAGQPGYHSRP